MTPISPTVFERDADSSGVLESARVHDGKGIVGVKYFFEAASQADPALLMMYILPPGASEGVHTHRLDDEALGSYDEFYYIVSGRGEMEIDGERVAVKVGDHVFTPNGVAHGIENTATEGDLKVYLVAMRR